MSTLFLSNRNSKTEFEFAIGQNTGKAKEKRYPRPHRGDYGAGGVGSHLGKKIYLFGQQTINLFRCSRLSKSQLQIRLEQQEERWERACTTNRNSSTTLQQGAWNWDCPFASAGDERGLLAGPTQAFALRKRPDQRVASPSEKRDGRTEVKLWGMISPPGRCVIKNTKVVWPEWYRRIFLIELLPNRTCLFEGKASLPAWSRPSPQLRWHARGTRNQHSAMAFSVSWSEPNRKHLARMRQELWLARDEIRNEHDCWEFTKKLWDAAVKERYSALYSSLPNRVTRIIENNGQQIWFNLMLVFDSLSRIQTAKRIQKVIEKNVNSTPYLEFPFEETIPNSPLKFEANVLTVFFDTKCLLTLRKSSPKWSRSSCSMLGSLALFSSAGVVTNRTVLTLSTEGIVSDCILTLSLIPLLVEMIRWLHFYHLVAFSFCDSNSW